MKRKGRKVTGKIIAAVLAVSMLLMAQGMPAAAEPVDAPAVQGVSDGAETAGGDAVDSVGREMPKNPAQSKPDPKASP